MIPIRFTQPVSDVRRLVSAPALDWEELARERERAAFERGRHAGEQALQQQLLEQRVEVRDMQCGILQGLQGAIPQVVREAESALIGLALEASRKVVAGLPVTRELVEAVVKEALQQVEDTADVRVRLHPDDLALLRQHDSGLLGPDPAGCEPVAGAVAAGRLRFEPAPEVARGGCVVDTRFGLVDATRETKLERLRETLEL